VGEGSLGVEAIFREARQIDDPRRRAAFVRDACGGDEALEAAVCRRLAASDEPSAVGAAAGVPGAADPGATSTLGLGAPPADLESGRIGDYTLLRSLGEGGFGSVFLAEQRAPVRRKVALKVIKPGMGSEQVVARFEAERQTLALMDHPNIAQIYDAGSTEAGRPYFVMELVSGVPITRYCDEHRSTLAERLDLFAHVCRAVHHAHTKGIIHRDLKPENILVTTKDDRPLPKVIDFGIAKAMHGMVTDRTPVTEHFQLMGTPVYMSPEQAEGSPDIDTRSDVYSLGVLLYELLTGSTPFALDELRRAGLGEMQRMFREVEPPHPSARVSRSGRTRAAIAAHRRIDPARLPSALRGELDWIAMKCLEKDRSRRYESAGALAAEIERHLKGEVVVAAPPSAVYRIRKFAGKHRRGVAAGVTVLVALVVALVASLYGLMTAARARREATAEAAKTRAALQFVVEMFGAVDPARSRGHDVTVAEVLDPAAEQVGAAFRGDADGETVVRHVLGQAYGHLGRYPESLRELERAWQLRESGGVTDDAESLSILHDLGATLLKAGETDRAREILHRAGDGRSRRLGPSHRDTLATRSMLAFAEQLAGNLEEAISEIRAVLRDQEAVLGPDDRDTLESMCSLADMLDGVGEFGESAAVAHQAAARAAVSAGPDSSLALMASSIEASALLGLSRDDEAAALLERVVRGKERLYGPDHPETLVSLDVLAQTLGALDRTPEALELSRAVVDRATVALGEGHDATLTYMNNLAQALRRSGRLDEAEPIYRRVIVLRRARNGAKAQETLMAMSNLGLLLLQRGRAGEALPEFQEALAGFRETLPSDHWVLGVALLNLGRCRTALGDYAEAEANLVESHALLDKALGPTHGRTTQARDALAELYDAWGRPDRARAWRASGGPPGSPDS